MRRFTNASIQRKQTFIIMATTAVALLLACAAFTTYEVITFRKAMGQNLSTLADIVDDNAAAALDFNDPKTAEETLSALRAEPAIVGACIFDRTGQVFVQYDSPGDEIDFKPPAKSQTDGYFYGKSRLMLYRVIRYKGETIGTVYLESDMRALYSRLEQYAVIVAVVFSLTLMAAFLLSARLQRFVSEPILHLAKTARDVVVDRNYSLRAAKRNDDELGVLTDGFNEMLAQIQERDAALQKNRDELERRVEQRTEELANSLSLLNATLESTADGILVAANDGKLTHFNEQFLAMWRIPRGIAAANDERQMLDIGTDQLKDPRQFLDRIKELYEQPDKDGFDVLEFKDGRIFERHSKPQRIGDKCVGRVWCFRDITERKKAEAELAHERDLLRSLLDNSPDCIYFKDASSRYLLCSKSVGNWFGVAPGEMAGKSDFDFVDSARAGAIRADEQKIMLTGQPAISQLEFIRLKNGSQAWMLTSKLPLRNQADEIIGTFGISKNITAIKEAEKELRWRTALFEALMNSSLDGILVINEQRKVIVQNQQFNRLLKVPQEIADDSDDNKRLQFVSDSTREPEKFREKVQYLYEHRDETSREEIEFKDGAIMDRYSSPVLDEQGNYYGRIWMFRDISDQKRMQREVEETHKKLLTSSRMAGMAEVATSVLHNVGNVLNSVNISSSLVTEKVRNSKVANLSKAVALMNAHAADLPAFFAHDPKGRQLPGYLGKLATYLMEEQAGIQEELASLCGNVEHIKEIVAMQQSYARVSGLSETLAVVDLVEDALRMNAGAMERHQVQVVREYSDVPPMQLERHKVLQILVNLIRNAKYAVDDNTDENKRVTLRVGLEGPDFVKISIIDNGMGIPAENLTRIFNHGFTTRKEGHGFGLHSAALAARELGGTLRVHSDGPGKGATFIVELPLAGKK